MARIQIRSSLLLSSLVVIGLSNGYVEKSIVPELLMRDWLRLKRETTSKTDTQKKGFTAEEKQNIVDKHNEYRRLPSAANMLYMSWDEDLETLAQKYANKCKWGHNKDRGKTGENLYAKTPRYNEEKAVKSWYEEEADYSYSGDSCRKGKSCGHYTQLVWADSDRVGCGIRYCRRADGLSRTDVYIIVCNYSPASCPSCDLHIQWNVSCRHLCIYDSKVSRQKGNLKDKKPYIKGSSCSKCPVGKEVCDEGLCRSGSGSGGKVTTKKPSPTTRKPKPTTRKPKPTTRKPKPTTRRPVKQTTKRGDRDVTTTATREVKSGTSAIATTSTTMYCIVMLLSVIINSI